MFEIKRVNKTSLAKIIALIYGLVGFVIALIIAIYTICKVITDINFQGSIWLVVLYNTGLGLLVGVLTSLVTALIGFIMGYIMAGLYNWFAKKVGGVKLEMEN